MVARAHIPNLLTVARVAAVPLCLVLILANPACKALALLVIFIAAALTDFLDGHLARKWKVVSPLGAMLDPIADKLLVALMLVYLTTMTSKVDSITGASSLITMPLFLPVAIMILREFYISGLREYLANRQIKLPVSKGGKWKTALQMIAIGLLLFYEAAAPNMLNCPYVAGFADDVAWASCPARRLLSDFAHKVGMATLYASAVLALTSAIGYTRAAWKHLR